MLTLAQTDSGATRHSGSIYGHLVQASRPVSLIPIMDIDDLIHIEANVPVRTAITDRLTQEPDRSIARPIHKQRPVLLVSAARDVILQICLGAARLPRRDIDLRNAVRIAEVDLPPERDLGRREQVVGLVLRAVVRRARRRRAQARARRLSDAQDAAALHADHDAGVVAVRQHAVEAVRRQPIGQREGQHDLAVAGLGKRPLRGPPVRAHDERVADPGHAAGLRAEGVGVADVARGRPRAGQVLRGDVLALRRVPARGGAGEEVVVGAGAHERGRLAVLAGLQRGGLGGDVGPGGVEAVEPEVGVGVDRGDEVAAAVVVGEEAQVARVVARGPEGAAEREVLARVAVQDGDLAEGVVGGVLEVGPDDDLVGGGVLVDGDGLELAEAVVDGGAHRLARNDGGVAGEVVAVGGCLHLKVAEAV